MEASLSEDTLLAASGMNTWPPLIAVSLMKHGTATRYTHGRLDSAVDRWTPDRGEQVGSQRGKKWSPVSTHRDFA